MEKAKECCWKKQLVSGLMTVAGLALLGLFISNGLKSIASRDQYVTVKGLAEREVLNNFLCLFN